MQWNIKIIVSFHYANEGMVFPFMVQAKALLHSEINVFLRQIQSFFFIAENPLNNYPFIYKKKFRNPTSNASNVSFNTIWKHRFLLKQRYLVLIVRVWHQFQSIGLTSSGQIFYGISRSVCIHVVNLWHKM